MPGEADTDFKLLADYSADVICRVGLDMRLLYVSPSCIAVLEFTPAEMLAMPPFALILKEDMPALIALAERNLLPGEPAARSTARMRKKDGSIVWMEVSPNVVRDPANGDPIETVIVLRDVTERVLLEQRLNSLALTDALTGLPNRRAFDEALEREWIRTVREGSQISLMLLDLDHFKGFNDRYGHQVGDDCLRVVAAAVRSSIRGSDMPARYGGEEIAVILPGADSAGAYEVAERVRVAIEALRMTHEPTPEGNGWVTASIGVATALSRDGGSMKMPASMLAAADSALYKAKHEGRNRVAGSLLMVSKEG